MQIPDMHKTGATAFIHDKIIYLSIAIQVLVILRGCSAHFKCASGKLDVVSSIGKYPEISSALDQSAGNVSLAAVFKYDVTIGHIQSAILKQQHASVFHLKGTGFITHH